MARKSNAQAYEEAEAELTKEAIADTEQEIFDDALGEAPLENDGDDSLEQMEDDELVGDDADEGEEGEGEPDETDEAEAGEDGEAAEEPQARQAGDDSQQDRQPGRVPSSALRESNERARAAEAERDAERARVRELDARLRLVEQGGPREQPKAAEKPDMFADPDAWAAHQQAQIEQRFEERRVNGSFAEARDGEPEKFDTAFRALQASDPATVQSIVKSHNPGRELMRWHDRQALLREIGNDPAAYEQRVREKLLADPEVRKQVITRTREDALTGDERGPRTRIRLPPSLSEASGGASHRGRDTDRSRTTRSTEREIFESAFED